MEFVGQVGGMIPVLCSGCSPAPLRPLQGEPVGGTAAGCSHTTGCSEPSHTNLSDDLFLRRQLAVSSSTRFLPPGSRIMTLMSVKEHLNGLFCGSLPTTVPSGQGPGGQTQVANGTFCWALLSVQTSSGLRLEISDRSWVCTA